MILRNIYKPNHMGFVEAGPKAALISLNENHN